MNKDKKTYHHGDLRNALILAARKLVDEGGATSLTMRKVTQEIGVSSTAAYRHFANKDELLACVLEMGFNELKAAMNTARLQAKHPVEGFFATGHAYLAFARNNPKLYQVLFSPECEKLMHPELLEAGKQSFSEVLMAAEICAEKGFLGKKDPMAIAMSGWVNVHGLASLHLDGMLGLVVPLDIEAATEALFNTLVSGVAPSANDFISQNIRSMIKKYWI